MILYGSRVDGMWIRYIVRILVLAAASGAAVALLDTGYLIFRYGGGEASETGLAHLTSLSWIGGLCTEGCLPRWAYRHLDGESWAAGADLFLRAWALSALISLVLLLPLLAILRARQRRLRPRREDDLLPLAATLATAAAVVAPVQDFVGSLGLTDSHKNLLFAGAAIGALLVAGAVQWGAGVLWFRESRFRRAVSRAAAGSGWATAALLGVSAAVLHLQIGTPSRAAPPVAPNVLLVSIDSLRPDHLHCYGYEQPTSPTIDRTASEGALFTQAISSSSWTLPSHMSLFTGLDPLQHGVVDDTSPSLPRAIPTLAETFRAAGYETAGVAATHYVSGKWGFARGFDRFEDDVIARLDGPTSERTTEIALAWIDDWNRRGRRRPLFLFVHFWDVHYGYQAPPPYDRMFSEGYDGTIDFRNFLANPDIREDMSAADYAELHAQYAAEIRFTDEHLKALLDRLESLGELDDTIVSISSDHGDEFFEHHWKGHRHTLFDELVRIAWIMRYPKRIPAGTVVTQTTEISDIGPTIVSLAGLSAPEFGNYADSVFAGRDLSPLLGGGTVPPRPAVSHLTPVGQENEGPIYSLRTPDAKLIWGPDEHWKLRFFDLAKDPGEQRDLGGGGDPREAAMLPALETWRDTKRSTAAGGTRVRLSPSEFEKLKDLGYIQ